MHYLVTGATGGFGGYALKFLKKMVPQNEIYALVRSEEKGEALEEAGFNIRTSDYGDLDSLKEALEGIDRLLFVSGVPGSRRAEHGNVVKAAQAAGVSYIACTSFTDADHPISILAPDHQFTEKMIRDLSIPHTFLRNNQYVEDELPIIGQALKTGQFAYAAGSGETGWASKREHVEAATKVLVENDSPEILELSGHLADYEELARALARATGKELETIEASNAALVENLKEAGFPQEATDMFLAIQHDIKKGQLAVSSGGLEEVLEKPLVSLEAALKEILDQE